MSALVNRGWGSRSSATVATMPFPNSSEDTAMRNRLRNLRDTVLVLGVQLVFRAMLALRRWNY